MRFIKNNMPHMLFWTISTYKHWEEWLYCCWSEVNLCHVNDTILTVTKPPLCSKCDIRDSLCGMSLQLAYCLSHNPLKDILASLCQSVCLLCVHIWVWAFVCVLHLRTCCLVYHKENNERPLIVLVECGRRQRGKSMSSPQVLGTNVQSACTMTHHRMRETGKQKDKEREMWP